MRKIVDKMWFTAQGRQIGLILTKDSYDNTFRAFIGLGTGLDEQLDADKIRGYGAKFPVNAAREIFKK